MYNDSMAVSEYLKRKKQKYDIGLIHGLNNFYYPPQAWGEIKLAYDRGYRKGQQMRMRRVRIE